MKNRNVEKMEMEKNEAQRLAVPLPEAFASIWFSINFPRVVRVVMGRGVGGRSENP